MGLVDVHVGGVGLCLLYLYEGEKVELEGCDGAGRGGAVNICDDKSRGNILQGGHGVWVGFGLVEVDVVRQW